MENFELLGKELELKSKAESEIDYVKSIKLESDADMRTATELVRQYKSQIAQIKDLFKKPKELAWQAHKEIKAREDALIAGFEEATKLLQRRMLEFTSAQRREIEEQQKRAAEARAEKEAALTSLDVPETEEALIEMVEINKPTKISGVYTKKRWEFEVEDLAKVPQSFAGVPMFTLDEKAVRRLVDSGVREIPGIRIYETEQLIVRKE